MWIRVSWYIYTPGDEQFGETIAAESHADTCSDSLVGPLAEKLSGFKGKCE